MTNALLPVSALADGLKTAVESEEPANIATAVQAIVSQQAEKEVVAELGQRLTTKSTTDDEQTVIAYALNAIDHPDTIEHFGKFLLNTKHGLKPRSVVLGFLQTRVRTDPSQTLTYLRQVLDLPDPQFRERIQSTFEFAITSIIVPGADTTGANTSAKQILVEAGIKPKHLQTALFREPGKLDATPIPIPSIFAEALGLIGGQEAVDLLCQLLNQHQTAQLNEEQMVGRNSRTAENQIDVGPIRERIMLAAVDALRTTELETAVNCLANTLVKNLNYKVQRQAADALGKLGFKSCIPHLLSALFVESNQPLKEKIGQSLSQIGSWQDKVTQLVVQLAQTPVQRDQIEAKVILTAVQPTQEELTKAPHLLTDFLIDAAIQRFNDERLLQIFADLIKTSTGNNNTIINEQLELYREKNNISEEILQALRVEIGGAQTLKPLLNKLEKNLLDYFQKPIDSLNTDTQTVWKRTIFLANLGFGLRISLNLAVFVIGAYFMIDSYNRIVAGTLTTQQLTTLMAVFIGGGATMFATFFTFPLKQIKRAVTDVGLANVAFISYIHGVLQISHTFSYFYLNGDITFAEIEHAARRIEETSHEAILTLNIAGSDADQTQFDKALLDRIIGPAKPQSNGAATPPAPPAPSG
ncbi:MAG: hypothetical protein R3D55_16840 [Chloroflexota bacterium]